MRSWFDRGQPGQAQSLLLDETCRIQRDRSGRSARPKSRSGRYRRLASRLTSPCPRRVEFSDRLDRSVQSRIKDDIPLDNGLCFDLTHPDAFKNNGKQEIATFDEEREIWVPVLNEEDFDLNRAAFSLPVMPPD